MKPCPQPFLSQINNDGARLIREEKFDDAIDTLASGLQFARMLIATSSGSEGRSECTMPIPLERSAENVDGTCSTPRPQQAAIKDIAYGSSDGTLPENSDEWHENKFLYSRPIVICQSDPNLFSFHSYAFMMMFNMALAYHLAAIESGRGSSFYFKSALDLYELAYALHLHEDLEVPLIYSCAIVNNIAQVQRSIDDDDTAKICFNHLLSIIMLIVEGSRREEVDSFSEALAGFFYNVSCLILKESLTAPAA
jgi:hypothetical protein